jgi:hypothetical protein
MGATFKSAEKYVKQIEADSVFVEIGSDRGEGSTTYLASLAEQFGTILHTVDITDRKNAINNHASSVWHVEVGSVWAAQTYPGIGKKISLLYLDNFDWIFDPQNIPTWITSQIDEYKKQFNINMTNENCQQEHLAQAQALGPWMSDVSVIMCDDTFPVRPHWQGKCGLAVPYFESIGFQVTELLDWSGVIMTRGLDFPEFIM